MFSLVLKFTTNRIVSASKHASPAAQMSTYTFNKHISLWQGTRPKKEYPPLDGDKKYDVASKSLLRNTFLRIQIALCCSSFGTNIIL